MIDKRLVLGLFQKRWFFNFVTRPRVREILCRLLIYNKLLRIFLFLGET